MGHQVHLTLHEREDIMLMRRDGRGVCEMARAIGRGKSNGVARDQAQLVRAPRPRLDRAAALRRAEEGVPQAARARRRAHVLAGQGQVPGRAVVSRADRGQARARIGRKPRQRHDHLPRHKRRSLRRLHRRAQGEKEAAPSRQAPPLSVGATRQDQGIARDFGAVGGRR